MAFHYARLTSRLEQHKLAVVMAKVFLRDGSVWVDDRRVELIAGEVHYWRLPPLCWRSVLESLRRLGCSVVSTYICWQYHELEKGVFDFDGKTDPARDLGSFLRLTKEMGFDVFIRPGPFIYSEWRNAGVPDRVVSLHRLSAEYQSEARTWMEAVTAYLKPFFATVGGPIVLFQADNESDLFSHWFESDLGMEQEGGDGTWQQFVSNTNVFAEPPGATLEDRRLSLNYWHFQHKATAKALKWHVDFYRSLDVDLPIVGNYYPGGDVQNWREISKTVDMQGIDWYPRGEFGKQASEHREFLDTCRLQSIYSPIPFIAEFECGVWHGFHDYVSPLRPNHYKLMAVSAMMAGITTWNWYMAVGRDNWYFTPINERGEMRADVAEPIIKMNELARSLDLPSLKKLTNTAVVFDVDQIGPDEKLRKNPILDALYQADIDYVFYDPQLDTDRKPLMIYAGSEWLSLSAQQNLRKYVEDGGNLVVFKQGPTLDAEMNPTNLLELDKPDRILSRLGKKVELDLGGVGEGAVWVWDEPHGDAIHGTQCAGKQQAVENADVWMTNYIGKRWICGYRKPVGKGSVIHIGLNPSSSIVLALHEWLGVDISCRAALPDVQTSLFKSPTGFVLMATNMNPSEIECRVTGHWLKDLESNEHATRVENGVLIHLDAYSGNAWRL
jgi:hypothetical protein